MGDDLINRNININRGFRKLDVWKEATDFFVFVKKKIDTASSISFKIKAQVEGSAFSTHSNIAEGYGRRNLKESIRFNSITLASLAENNSQIFALQKSDIIDYEWIDIYDSVLYSLDNKLMSYNKSQVKQLREKFNWQNDYVVRELIEIYGSSKVG